MRKIIFISLFTTAVILWMAATCNNSSKINSQTSSIPADDPQPQQPVTKGLPVNWPWRGVSIESKTSRPSDIDYLAGIHVNFVRIQLKPPKRADRENISPVEAFYRELAWADSIMESLKKHNMTSVLAFNFLVLDPKDPVDDKSPEFWEKKVYRDTVYRMVDYIASKWKERGDELSAYEVIGEPAVRKGARTITPPGIEDFYQNILKAIRRHDTKRYVVVSPGPWGKPTNYVDFNGFNLNDNRLIYGAHMYLPDEYTHQGVKKRDKGISYPGIISGKNWNRNIIVNRLNAIREFEKKHNALIYIGEYQAARWSKGSDEWVKDVTETMDSYGWSWSYFAYKAGQDFWDPFYEVANPSDKQENWKLKYTGPESKQWKYMIQEFSKNKK